MKKSLVGILAAAIIFGGSLFSSQASAATTANTSVTQSITGGTRDVVITPTTTFNPVTLNGEPQVTNANPGTLSITDASGTGEGYRVAVSASRFTVKAPAGGFAAGTTAKQLPTGSLKLTKSGSAIAATGGTTSTAPNWVGDNFSIDSGSPVTILSAAKDSGMGKYTVTFGSSALALNLAPSSTYVDTENYTSTATPYISTLTYQIITGP